MDTLEVKLIKEGAKDARGLLIHGPVVLISIETPDGYGEMQFSVLHFEQLLDDWRAVARGQGREMEKIHQLTLHDLGSRAFSEELDPRALEPNLGSR